MTMHGYYVGRRDGQLMRVPEHSADRLVCVQPSPTQFLLFSEGGTFLFPDENPQDFVRLDWVPQGIWLRIADRARRMGHTVPPRNKGWLLPVVPPLIEAVYDPEAEPRFHPAHD